LRLAPANETLALLLQEESGAGQFDFVFIDADKTGYDHYYEQSLKLLRPGGLIMLDNCLWGGLVLDDKSTDEDTQALRALNKKIATDHRVTSSLVPVGDGIQMVCKR
jgi:O-methyltransferase